MLRSTTMEHTFSDTDFCASVLTVAASRSLLALGEALHREIQRLIGSRSVGLYALDDRLPRLLFSRQTPEGFLRAYDARLERSDMLVDRMCDRGHAIDGYTEMGAAAWRSSGSLDLLNRWGYSHCMGGPLSVDGRVMGVVYATSHEQTEPYGSFLLRRMDMLCRAGSIALTHMIDAGSIPKTPGAWTSCVEPNPALPHLSCVAQLPRRSREVGALVSQGRTNKEIARALGLSVHTVKDYVGNLCKRMGAQNRTELAHRFASGQN